MHDGETTWQTHSVQADAFEMNSPSQTALLTRRYPLVSNTNCKYEWLQRIHPHCTDTGNLLHHCLSKFFCLQQLFRLQPIFISFIFGCPKAPDHCSFCQHSECRKLKKTVSKMTIACIHCKALGARRTDVDGSCQQCRM